MSISTIVDCQFIERKLSEMFVEFKLVTTGLAAVLTALVLTGSGITTSTEINAIEYSEGYTIEPTQSGNGLLIIDSHRGCELICNK